MEPQEEEVDEYDDNGKASCSTALAMHV